jgi:hypothetical protein
MTRKLKLGWEEPANRRPGQRMFVNGKEIFNKEEFRPQYARQQDRKRERWFVDGEEIYSKDEYDSIVRQRNLCSSCTFRSGFHDKCMNCSDGNHWTPIRIPISMI